MDDEKYSRSVKLICSTCASGDFEYEDENGPYRCVSCDRVFTREELMGENGHIIDAHVEEMGAEVLKDAEREIRDMLGKAFSGSKNIKFK
jgi:hypothetical protein